MVNNMSLSSVYLGLNGMNVVSTEFYYVRLLQPNVSNRLISLRVSDTLAIDNGLWLAEHLFAFINLRHLSLIDIKRTSFELILNSFSPNTSLLIFSVDFPTYGRTAYTYDGVPEGAYYERIFRLFPLLHVCHLRFYKCIYKTLDRQIVLPLGKAFMTIETSLFNLQSIVLRHCSLNFLSHLLEHLPQLQELTFELSTSWLPDRHSLTHNNTPSAINKRLAPNLQRLKIKSDNYRMPLAAVDQLFEYDVFFSLTKFTLLGIVNGPHVVQKLISMLSNQCLYSLHVWWSVETAMALPNTSIILSDTFRQLEGRMPVEIELSLQKNSYCITVFTVPRMNETLFAFRYLDKNTVLGQSRWPYTMRASNRHLVRFSKINMDSCDAQIVDELLSYSPFIVSWHEITSLYIDERLNLAQLHLIFSQTINLRTLELSYDSTFSSESDSLKKKLIDLFNDASLCSMLMSNGLRQLNLSIWSEEPYLIDIAYLIVKRLSNLQVIELQCASTQTLEMLYILVNGLSKLNFITVRGGLRWSIEHHRKLFGCAPQNYFMRPFKREIYDQIDDIEKMFIWL